MKLLILLSVIALSYGDKLDRTYLPPASAGSAGGSPGALIAPGLSSFGTSGPANQQTFGQQPFGQPQQNSFGGQPGQLTGQSVRGPGSSSPSGGAQPGLAYLPPNGRLDQALDSNSGFGLNAPLSGSQPSSFGGSSAPSSYTQRGPSDTFGYNEQGSQQSNSFNQVSGPSPSVFAPQSNQPERAQSAADKSAEILKNVNENDGDRFTYSYETSNGISAEESGEAAGGVKAHGGYSYTGDDGKAYTITYTADEQGFQPQGEHLPTPHPIPEEILKSIEKNAQAAAAGTQEGAYRPEDNESDDNSQGYGSGAPAYSGSQGQVQASSQQFNAPSGGRPTSEDLSYSQIGSNTQGFNQNQNGNLNQPSFGGSQQGFGSGNQGQSQSQGASGYQYSQPQSSQYSSGISPSSQAFGSQSRPQFGSQSIGQSLNGQTGSSLNGFNNPSGPNSQASSGPDRSPQGQPFGNSGAYSQPSNQGPQYQSGSNQNQRGSSGYQYQPASGSGASSQPIAPSQYQSGSLSSNQYSSPSLNQAQNVQSTPDNSYRPANGFSSTNGNRPIASGSPQGQFGSGQSGSGQGFPTPGAKESAQIQAPYEYNRPSQSYSSQGPSQSGFQQPSTQGQQSSFNQPDQSLNSQGQGSQAYNRPEQFGGARQPPSFNAQEGYKY